VGVGGGYAAAHIFPHSFVRHSERSEESPAKNKGIAGQARNDVKREHKTVHRHCEP